MPEDFFETLKSQNAGIFISFYPPMVSKMDSIRDMLNKKGVNYFITELNKIFSIKQTLNKHNQPQNAFLNCFQANCNNLYEGKIAACFLPFTTKYFNSYFDKNLPEDGAINLYDENLTTEILKYKLKQPFERCCYCTNPVDINWQSIKYPSVLSDWVNEY
ncbi:MAG: hypothetical protein IJ563_00875 [Selenomonadaceae bacterium]|nr:hypothetical protein [Selenomonadaceae bacterium]